MSSGCGSARVFRPAFLSSIALYMHDHACFSDPLSSLSLSASHSARRTLELASVHRQRQPPTNLYYGDDRAQTRWRTLMALRPGEHIEKFYTCLDQCHYFTARLFLNIVNFLLTSNIKRLHSLSNYVQQTSSSTWLPKRFSSTFLR